MVALIGVIVVDVVGGLYAAGYATGNANSPPTVSLPSGGRTDDCQAACVAWDNARQMQCGARADEAAAKSRADGIRGMLVAAIAAAAALAAAAAATFVAAAAATATFFGIPAGIVLTGIAIGLSIAAATAAGAAIVLAGQLTAAEADLAEKASARQTWDAAVTTARDNVNKVCSVEQANACLSRTAPC
jgi:hypothetical protein